MKKSLDSVILRYAGFGLLFCAALYGLYLVRGTLPVFIAGGVIAYALEPLLKKLEARGLVERVRGTQTDGRAAMVRITLQGRNTRKQLDGLMRQRTSQIVDSIPEAKRTEVLNALQILNNAIEAAGCCAFNAPVAKLVRIEADE